MLENTISIDSQDTLTQTAQQYETADAEKDNVLPLGEEADWHSGEEASAAEDAMEQKGEAASEENTTLEDEEMLTLTVYGDTVTVSKSEAISAAQRGVAFDTMKQKLALAKGDARIKALDDLAQISGKSVSQLLGDMTRQALTNQMTEKYGQLDMVPDEEFEAAMQQVFATRKSLEQTADKWTLTEKRSQLEEFLQYNPGCREIPPQVIARAKQGVNLTLAYSQYETQQLKAQLEQAQQELSVLKSGKAAKEKSMPSAKSTVADGNTKSMYGMMKSLW